MKTTYTKQYAEFSRLILSENETRRKPKQLKIINQVSETIKKSDKQNSR